jgi:hypothetical protein
MNRNFGNGTGRRKWCRGRMRPESGTGIVTPVVRSEIMRIGPAEAMLLRLGCHMRKGGVNCQLGKMVRFLQIRAIQSVQVPRQRTPVGDLCGADDSDDGLGGSGPGSWNSWPLRAGKKRALIVARGCSKVCIPQKCSNRHCVNRGRTLISVPRARVFIRCFPGCMQYGPAPTYHLQLHTEVVTLLLILLHEDS